MKYGFPTAYTLSMLALGFVEFQDSYDKADLTKYLRSALKWGADYLIKAHVSKYKLIGQVLIFFSF